ncbi:hypothetical protein C882_3601 [Caenispirillum salinarum AK4]|uniref:Iron-regulated membrane protein n=1 Tax=Caenispirillum salinarum AK4 TaxID=1238182 RepID=K9H446_9PROT|nr:PepSY-associated TM helix domain-containing protein [Caenispirillum salinarum]EKV31849.1 hypothetical protein C882_3601 [Caenispirillum salinarum AK4]
MALTQSQMKRLTAVHGWSGTILGLLLFVVVSTGTLAVFSPEIERWSVGVSAPKTLDAPIDGIVRNLADKMPNAMREEVGIWRDARGNLVAFFHTHIPHPESGKTEDYGTLFHIDPATGAVLDRAEGFVWTEPSLWVRSALEYFLVHLHVELFLPDPWGLVATGILGLLMMAAALTGGLMHRHLIRDLFVAERPGGRLASVRDRHVLAATWGLPFAVILAFTGSYYSFAGTVTRPLLAEVAYAGDQDRLRASLFQPTAAEDARRAPPADLDRMIARATEEGGTAPTFLSITNYGRADSRAHVWHPAAPGRLSWGSMVFETATGTFLGPKPTIGNTPSAGSTLVGLIWPLHTGDFAGLASKAVWGALGGAMCFVILSGLRLWVRRRDADPLWRAFGRAVLATGCGVPLAMVACAHVFFLAQPFGTAAALTWTPAGFFAAALGCLALAWRMADVGRLRRLYLALFAYGCLLLPAVRLACGGTSWANALAQGHGVVVAVDGLLLAAGAAALARHRGWVGRWSRHSRTEKMEPAE